MTLTALTFSTENLEKLANVRIHPFYATTTSHNMHAQSTLAHVALTVVNIIPSFLSPYNSVRPVTLREKDRPKASRDLNSDLPGLTPKPLRHPYQIYSCMPLMGKQILQGREESGLMLVLYSIKPMFSYPSEQINKWST